MFPLNSSSKQNINPNLIKKTTQAMNCVSEQINLNHRVCQAGDKACINRKKANMQFG